MILYFVVIQIEFFQHLMIDDLDKTCTNVEPNIEWNPKISVAR